jgi:hypothetical protein
VQKQKTKTTTTKAPKHGNHAPRPILVEAPPAAGWRRRLACRPTAFQGAAHIPGARRAAACAPGGRSGDRGATQITNQITPSMGPHNLAEAGQGGTLGGRLGIHMLMRKHWADRHSLIVGRAEPCCCATLRRRSWTRLPMSLLHTYRWEPPTAAGWQVDVRHIVVLAAVLAHSPACTGRVLQCTAHVSHLRETGDHCSKFGQSLVQKQSLLFTLPAVLPSALRPLPPCFCPIALQYHAV